MTWLALLSGIIKLAGNLADYLGDRQLLKAGEHKAVRANLEKILEDIAKARTARRAVKSDPDSLRNDPANRDGPILPGV